VFLSQYRRPSFTSVQNHRQNYSLEYSPFYVFRQKTRRKMGSGLDGSKHHQNAVS
jgi:hypothetical protein